MESNPTRRHHDSVLTAAGLAGPQSVEDLSGQPAVDTICAVATAPGGALGIVRVSGSQALAAVSAIFSKDLRQETARTLHHGFIREPAGDIVDEVVVSIMRAPHSYTGDDSAEITCHGSAYILSRILTLLCDNGCRTALPGEYTMRAYLNGKLDLSQAEAVADVIAASNAATHRVAMSQLRGGISTELGQLREQLLRLTSLLELELDFSDHEDLVFADRTELLDLARQIDSRVSRLAHSFETGQALKHGIPVAIVGQTNVGKSTLLNRLLHDDRAIVSAVHGTTRDTIEDVVNLHGVAFRFIDTAGLRDTSDVVEQIGIQRTHQAIERARIVVWLTDQRPTPLEISEMQELCEGKEMIVVQNKVDTASDYDRQPWTCPMYFISAKHDIGIAALEEAIFAAAHLSSFLSESSGEEPLIISNARHYEVLLRAQSHLAAVMSSIQAGLSGDLIAEDLRAVLNTLAEITGTQITPQETLSNIFSHFCVGK